MSEFFDRKLELIIGNTKFLYPDFKIKFDVKFDKDPKPNEATITIYNLSNDSITSLSKGKQIVVNAGYGNDIGNILAGTVQSVESRIAGVDKETIIKAIDVSDKYIASSISKTYNPDVTASFIINDIFKSYGIAVGDIDLKEDKIYKNGFVAQGKIKDIAQRIAEECGSELVIKNSSIEINPKTKGTKTGYLLNSETGLLNIQKVDKKDSDVQYKLSMLLNHNVNSKSLLRVESYIFTGNVIVIQGSHKDFKTSVEVATYG